MRTLKKGDLVMTEHGIRRYAYTETNTDFIVGCRDKWCSDLIGLGAGYFHTVTPLSSKHRPQVEAYLKGKGWEKYNYTGFANKEVNYSINPFGDNGEFVLIPFFEMISPKYFDTAPEQLREAITMARLLNATKEG